MSRNQAPKLVKRTEQHDMLVCLNPNRWDSTPGVIPKAVVRKRRAKNKAARHSRQKNR